MSLMFEDISETTPPALNAERAQVVLHVRVVTGVGGGPEKTILNSPRFLNNMGYRTLCAYMHPPDDPGFETLKDRASQANAPLLSIPDRGLRDFSVLRRLLDVCESEKVDIWHAHDYKSNLIGLALSRKWPMKLITTAHGWVKFTRKTPLYHFVDRFCQRRYDKVLCVSPDIYDTCIAHGVSSQKCQIIDNAIDHTQYRRTMSIQEAKLKIGCSTDKVLIGAVGRLSEEKGFDLLIQSVNALVAKGHNIQLVIAGEGDARPHLEKVINAQSHPDRFQLLGHRNDLETLYQAMDLFVLSSLREGLPNVLLEAMAFEVPVVATRIAGVPRLVRDGVNGILIDPGQQQEISQAVERMLSDANLLQSYARSGREIIELEFSFEHRMKKICAIYDELLLENR